LRFDPGLAVHRMMDTESAMRSSASYLEVDVNAEQTFIVHKVFTPFASTSGEHTVALLITRAASRRYLPLDVPLLSWSGRAFPGLPCTCRSRRKWPRSCPTFAACCSFSIALSLCLCRHRYLRIVVDWWKR